MAIYVIFLVKADVEETKVQDFYKLREPPPMHLRQVKNIATTVNFFY